MKKNHIRDSYALFLTSNQRIFKIMKLFFAFILVCVSSAFATGAYSQSAKVSIKVEQGYTKEVLQQIESQTNYLFVYNSDKINMNKKISINVVNETVAKVLDKVFAETNVNYVMQGDNILLTYKEISSKSSVLQQSNNKIKVQGTVVDSKGEALIGASVVEKGTTNGVITNMDGHFSLTVATNAVLEVSYMGYTPKSISVGKNTNLTITLNEDTEVLDEVVVVGYALQKKVNLSGAVATVSTKQLENRPVTSVGQALQGTVANLNVTVGSGKATDSPSFNIRGTTSLNGGDPLIVIDGVISSAWVLNNMTPNDIASISVLKDAASCAIYGSRAAYGVILITTKAGASEKLTVSYNNNFSMRSNTQMPDIISDPYEVASWRNKMSYPWYNMYNEEELAYAKKVSEDPSTSPYFLNPSGTYSYFGNTDWVNEAYKKSAFSTNHTIDLSGKTEKVSYYLSAGYNFTDGMIKYGTDKFQRYNLRSKLSFNITKNWTVANNTNLTIKDYEAPNGLGSGYYWGINRLSPLDVPRNPDGTWTVKGAEYFGNFDSGGRSKEKGTHFSTQFTTRLDIIKNVLFVNGNFSFTTDKNRNSWHSLPVAYYDGPDREPYYKNEVSGVGGNSSDSKNITFDAYATFSKTFNEKHAITAIAGFNQEEYRYENVSYSRDELISTSLPSIGLATGDMSMGESISTLALRGVYGRLNYTFADKYIVEFNGRYDGTSRFPTDSRFVFSPSGSAAWVVSKEKFFEPLTKVVSFMKFRYSYGVLGNQDMENNYYPYIAGMGSGKMSRIIDGKQPVYVSAPGLVSGDLTWEKVSTSNFGLDMNFFNNRLSFSGDVYVRRTKDMLTEGQALPNVLGTPVPLANAADLKTEGWEITLGWKDQVKLAGKPFNYQLGFNLADSRAYITKFDNPTGTLGKYYAGCEIGEIWGYTTLGFFTSEEDIKNHADQSKLTSYPGTRPLAPGDLKFADLDGDRVVYEGDNTIDDHGDKSVIGNSRKRFTFGFTAAADWNGLDFSLFIQGVGKRDYNPSGDLYFWGIYAQPWTNITEGNYYDHWTEENPNAYFPRLKAYVAELPGKEAGLTQTRYLQNAAYMRLKNLTVGYTLPAKWMQKAGISRVRVYFSGDNMFELSGLYKHYKVDPEGLGGRDYPLQRSYSLGLNVTF